MTTTRRVYVLGFAPHRGEGSVGGFEWRATMRELGAVLLGLLAEPANGTDYRIGPVDVPEGLDGQTLTDWLDARPDLWEPPDVPEDPGTPTLAQVEATVAAYGVTLKPDENGTDGAYVTSGTLQSDAAVDLVRFLERIGAAATAIGNCLVYVHIGDGA